MCSFEFLSENVSEDNIKKYSIEEIFNLIGKENLSIPSVSTNEKMNIEIDGYKVYAKSLRYATFYQKGTKCACCGKEGTHFRLDSSESPDPLRRHLNLYADDGTLITKDHIIPKKLGGKDYIDNMQTMCSVCNHDKGIKADLIVNGIVGTNVNNGTKKYFVDIEDAVFFLCGQFISRIEIKKGNLVKRSIETTKKFIERLNTDQPLMHYLWTEETFNANMF